MTSVEWTDTDATITFNWGRCTLRATPDTLTVRMEGTNEERLHRLQTLITHRLESISRRDTLRAIWRPEPSVSG